MFYADTNDLSEVYTKTTLGYERCEVRITNLKPFTTYRISVKAFNSIGPGPDSDFIRVTTNEGGKKKSIIKTILQIISSSFGLCDDIGRNIKLFPVPDEPPQNVQCSPLTAESLRMSWDPPPVQSHHGTILGYKIHYKKMNPVSGESFPSAVGGALLFSRSTVTGKMTATLKRFRVVRTE